MEQQKLINLLLDCLHADPSRIDNDRLNSMTTTEWDNFISLVAKQRVRALLFHRLKSQNFLDSVPEDVHRSLGEFYRRNALRNMVYFSELRAITKAFQDASIPVIALKGVYLADVVYQNIALREMNDIDLLVQKKDLEKAANILMEMAYQPLKPFSLDWDPTYFHLPPFIKTNVASVEIHWSVIEPDRSPNFNIGDFWNSAKPVELTNIEILSLAPEDVLLFLCFHNANHGFAFSLRPYCDIQAAILHFSSDFNWDTVIERAVQWRWDRAVYLSLQLSNEFVGAKTPEYVLDTLKPNHDFQRIYVMAKTQTFADIILANEIRPSIANFNRLSVLGKAILLLRRFFPSRLEMANLYNSAPDSLTILFKYPLRWKDLIVQYLIPKLKVQDNDEELTELTKRKGEIWHWLFDEQ